MTDYLKLKDIIDELSCMTHTRAAFSSSEFDSWYSRSERILTEIFGADSYEVNYFTNTSYALYIHAANASDDKYEESCSGGLASIRDLLMEYMKLIENTGDRCGNIEPVYG